MMEKWSKEKNEGLYIPFEGLRNASRLSARLGTEIRSGFQPLRPHVRGNH